MLTEFMDVLRDDERSILFSSHNTLDVERISDRLCFIDRGHVVADDDTGSYLERWRRVQVRLPADAALPALPHVVGCERDGSFATLTVNGFSDAWLARINAPVQAVQRMSLEEIFCRHRDAQPRRSVGMSPVIRQLTPPTLGPRVPPAPRHAAARHAGGPGCLGDCGQWPCRFQRGLLWSGSRR